MLTTGHGSLSSENAESCFSIHNDILLIRKQRIGNALNTIIGHLNINSIRPILTGKNINIIEIFV